MVGGCFFPLLCPGKSYFGQKPAGPTLKEGISQEKGGNLPLSERNCFHPRPLLRLLTHCSLLGVYFGKSGIPGALGLLVHFPNMGKLSFPD